MVEASCVAGARLFVFFSDPAEEAEVRDWVAALPLARKPEVLPQAQSDDLGVRMRGALDTMLEAGVSVGVVMGSDIPGLTTAVLERAVTGMATADVVLGPSVDGGFYLIAARETDEGMFRGVEWSTETVLERTMARAAALRWACRLDMPVLQDIDTVDDLRAWVRDMGSDTSPLSLVCKEVAG